MPCPENVVDADDILMVKTQQDLDFPQCALAVRLVLKGADFLDGNALVCHVVQGRAGRGGKYKTALILHTAQSSHTMTVSENWAGAKLQKGVADRLHLPGCTCDTCLFDVMCCEVL